jgi:hypothetical protein
LYTDSSQQGDTAVLSSTPGVFVFRIALQDVTLSLAIIRISAPYVEADEDSLVYGWRKDLSHLLRNTCLVPAKRETETERYRERDRVIQRETE